MGVSRKGALRRIEREFRELRDHAERERERRHRQDVAETTREVRKTLQRWDKAPKA